MITFEDLPKFIKKEYPEDKEDYWVFSHSFEYEPDAYADSTYCIFLSWHYTEKKWAVGYYNVEDGDIEIEEEADAIGLAVNKVEEILKETYGWKP